MKIIRNTKLFKEVSVLETDDQAWKALFTEDNEKKDIEIPTLTGGLDHVDQKLRGVYFYDIGCNGKDNSFVLRPEIN